MNYFLQTIITYSEVKLQIFGGANEFQNRGVRILIQLLRLTIIHGLEQDQMCFFYPMGNFTSHFILFHVSSISHIFANYTEPILYSKTNLIFLCLGRSSLGLLPQGIIQQCTNFLALARTPLCVYMRTIVCVCMCGQLSLINNVAKPSTLLDVVFLNFQLPRDWQRVQSAHRSIIFLVLVRFMTRGSAELPTPPPPAAMSHFTSHFIAFHVSFHIT